MAIAILGWPLEKLSPDIAGEVISGARSVCDNADIPLAGGHSISSADPFFGLAVTGLVDSDKVKQNNKAKAGCKLFLSKPLGIGLVSSAEKFGEVKEEDKAVALELMTRLNREGTLLSDIEGVAAMTDVTGFGLGGHLLEMAEGSGLCAVVNYSDLPKIAGVDYYIEKKCMPGGTFRNFKSYGHKMEMDESYKPLVCDPQTSGGLLIAVEPDAVSSVMAQFPDFKEIGTLQEVDKDGIFCKII